MKKPEINWAFDNSIKPRKLARDAVEATFPEKHYGEIFTYEAWPMRAIIENIVEIALKVNDKRRKKRKKRK